MHRYEQLPAPLWNTIHSKFGFEQAGKRRCETGSLLLSKQYHFFDRFIQIKEISSCINKVEIQLFPKNLEVPFVFCIIGNPVDRFNPALKLDGHVASFKGYQSSSWVIGDLFNGTTSYYPDRCRFASIFYQ